MAARVPCVQTCSRALNERDLLTLVCIMTVTPLMTFFETRDIDWWWSSSKIWSIQAKIMGGPLPLAAAMQCLPWGGATVCKKSEQARWLHVKPNPRIWNFHRLLIKGNKLSQSETWIAIATTMLQKLKLSLSVNIFHWSFAERYTLLSDNPKVMKEPYDPKSIPLITQTCVTGKYVT